MILKTERLIISKGSMEDYDKVFDGSCEVLKNKESGYIIYLKQNNIPVGYINADREDKLNKSIEISYNIHPNYWGNGYCPEATVEFMDYLYKKGYENIVCSYYEGNSKSKRVIEKIGFTPYMVDNSLGLIKNIKCILSKEDYYTIYKDKEKSL